MGEVAFNGLFSGVPQSLEQLPNGLWWDKTYLDIPRDTHKKIAISIRPLTEGRVGLNWGTQDLNEKPGTASKGSLEIETLHLLICNGSGGFAGGFVLTQPLCAEVVLHEGTKAFSRQLQFGNADCPKS
jgi:hypothetical protein